MAVRFSGCGQNTLIVRQEAPGNGGESLATQRISRDFRLGEGSGGKDDEQMTTIWDMY